MLALKQVVEPPLTPLKLEIDVVTAQYALGTLGPVLLQLWQLGTPEDGARKARAMAKGLFGRGYEQTCSLIVVPETSVLPSEVARKECAQIPKDLYGCTGLALVREGEGFRAAAVRALMTGMMSFGQVAPYKIVATVKEGCDWLEGRMPSLSAQQIQRAQADLRHAWLKSQ
jgi:hypothetical protein